MAGENKKRELDERLDELGRVVVLRASAVDDVEADAAASSPFLYARIRSRIASEQGRRAAGEKNWLALLNVVWRSAPAMALVAVFAFVLFWSASPVVRSPSVLSDEALLGERVAGIEQVVFADRSQLSNDEVLATILNEDEQEASR